MFSDQMKLALLEGSRELTVAAMRSSALEAGEHAQLRRAAAIAEFLGRDLPLFEPMPGRTVSLTMETQDHQQPKLFVRFVIDEDGAVQLFYAHSKLPVATLAAGGYVDVVPEPEAPAEFLRDLLRMIAEAT